MIQKLLKIALFTSLCAFAAAEDFYISDVDSVYDGDTFKVNIKDIPAVFGESLSIRLRGVDTPEIRGSSELVKKYAYAARDFTFKKLTEANEIVLKNAERGKYFRLLADVFVDGESLADLLIKNQFARPYDGGTRIEWTDQEAELFFAEHPEL